jgi:hypothetical protein
MYRFEVGEKYFIEAKYYDSGGAFLRFKDCRDRSGSVLVVRNHNEIYTEQEMKDRFGIEGESFEYYSNDEGLALLRERSAYSGINLLATQDTRSYKHHVTITVTPHKQTPLEKWNKENNMNITQEQLDSLKEL